MAKRIEGITIELNGDTTGLSKALEGVNRKIAGTQSQLKDVNKLLKLDPGNVELLSQKQKLLGEAVGATREKLDKLKIAGEQANEALARGDITRTQYDALQREIIETEQQMKSLTKEMRDFGSVSAQVVANAGKQVQQFGDRVSKAGAGLSKGVTAPIVAAGAASVAAWNEVDEGLDIVTRKTGATGEALADMQRRAKNLATGIPTDFRTAGAAVGEVNTRFSLTGQALEDLSGKFIKFADLNDTDVSSAIDGVQSALAAFNLDLSRAGNMIDILNAAGQETGVNVGKLSGDLAANATLLREMGLNAADSALFLARLEKNGVDASAVLTGLKTAMKGAMKQGQTLGQALGGLQGRIAGAASRAQAMAIAAELFGNKAGPALGAALYEGRLSLDQMGLSLNAFAGNVEDTFAETQDPMDEFKMSMNELKIVGADLVESAAPMLKEVARQLRDAIVNLRGWWEGLSPLQQRTVIKLAGIAAAAGPVLVAAGRLISLVGTLMTLAPQLSGVITTAKGAFTALGGAMAANPVGLVIVAVTALTAAFMHFWNTSEKFRRFWMDLWKGIAETVSFAVDRIRTFFAFKWELPKIKLPHFRLEGSFSLAPPSVPTLSVEWYRKAMDGGMILNSPTIFGAAGNRLLGGGEAGPEAVVGTSALSAMIAEAVARGNQGGPSASRGGPRNLTVILELDRQQLGRVVYRLNNDEAQRVGVKLAGGGA